MTTPTNSGSVFQQYEQGQEQEDEDLNEEYAFHDEDDKQNSTPARVFAPPLRNYHDRHGNGLRERKSIPDEELNSDDEDWNSLITRLHALSFLSPSLDETPTHRHYLKTKRKGVTNCHHIPGDFNIPQNTPVFDIQGIPWERSAMSRAEYRAERHQSYHSYRDTSDILPSAWWMQDKPIESEKTGNHSPRGFPAYTFQSTCRVLDSFAVPHLQLRHAVHATSSMDVFYSTPHGIRCWCPATSTSVPVLTYRHLGHGEFVARTMTAAHPLVWVSGSDSGEYFMLPLDRVERDVPRVIHHGYTSHDEGRIVNHARVGVSSGGRCEVVLACNDGYVDVFDVEQCRVLGHEGGPTCPWPVNATASDITSQYAKLQCVVGDNREAILMDKESGNRVARLPGHLDYVYACAWQGHYLATGGQDCCTRIWDVRMMQGSRGEEGTSMLVPTRLPSAVRALSFHPVRCGVLCVAEDADFVQVVQVTGFSSELSGLESNATTATISESVDDGEDDRSQRALSARPSRRSPPLPSSPRVWPFRQQDPLQEQPPISIIDYFGELAGLSLAPEGGDLFLGNVDYGTLSHFVSN